MAKHSLLSFPHKPYTLSTPFSLIHSDIWGPSSITTSHGKRWFITFLNDHTRATWVYLFHNKSDANKTFQTFHQMIQTQFQARVQILRTDKNISILISGNTYHVMARSIKVLVFILHNKIGYQNAKIVIYEKSLVSSCLPCMFQSTYGDAILTATYLIK